MGGLLHGAVHAQNNSCMVDATNNKNRTTRSSCTIARRNFLLLLVVGFVVGLSSAFCGYSLMTTPALEWIRSGTKMVKIGYRRVPDQVGAVWNLVGLNRAHLVVFGPRSGFRANTRLSHSKPGTFGPLPDTCRFSTRCTRYGPQLKTANETINDI